MSSPAIWIVLTVILLLPVVFTYLIYPALIELIYIFRRNHIASHHSDITYLPDVHVIMAVHNEEKVLPKKLKALSNLSYQGNIYFWIGSDASTDATNNLLENFASEESRSHVRYFNQRTGKAGILNSIMTEVTKVIKPDAVLFLTDVDILFPKDLVEHAIPQFLDKHLGILDIPIVSNEDDKEAIYEDKYWESENRLKQREGALWGCTMGVSGGCYFLRRELFVSIPDNFLVDDFFLSMHTLKAGFSIRVAESKVALSLAAFSLQEEFRRKRRIAAGNWQNHHFYKSFFRNSFFPIGFCYLGHKWLRWVTPSLLMLNLLVLLGWTLSGAGGRWFPIIILSLSIATPCTSLVLSKLNLQWKPLDGLSYFMAMQLALAAGAIDYLKGIHTNVWKPTSRI